MSGLFERVSGLDVAIDTVSWERLEFETPRWVRVSTVVCLVGGGHVGQGEDVSYATPDQDALRPPAQTQWRNLFLAGDWVQNGLPATIEGALRSGDSAARLALGQPLRYGAA